MGYLTIGIDSNVDKAGGGGDAVGAKFRVVGGERVGVVCSCGSVAFFAPPVMARCGRHGGKVTN